MRIWFAPLLVACGGGDAPSSSVQSTPVVDVPQTLLNQSWQLSYASPDAMGAMASKASWGAYFKKDYESKIISHVQGENFCIQT